MIFKTNCTIPYSRGFFVLQLMEATSPAEPVSPEGQCCSTSGLKRKVEIGGLQVSAQCRRDTRSLSLKLDPAPPRVEELWAVLRQRNMSLCVFLGGGSAKRSSG